MQAWHFHGTGKPLQAVELPDPEPAEGEVVLDIGGSGLCHGLDSCPISPLFWHTYWGKGDQQWL